MNIVIDTNLLMSLLIKPDGIVADIFNKLGNKHSLFISDRTLTEIARHNNKILKASRLSADDVELLKIKIFGSLNIIPSGLLSPVHIQQAYPLVKDIDIDDLSFVATTFLVDSILWTGDKKLSDGIKAKGYSITYQTKDILHLL